MLSINKEWNLLQAKLNTLLKSKNREDGFAAIKICFNLHEMVHLYKNMPRSYMQYIKENLNDSNAYYQSNTNNSTIVWNIWHITRIEDAVTNILIMNQDQVFNEYWKANMNVRITDTGNAMTKNEIAEFSRDIKIKMLWNYRLEVGKSTVRILKKLKIERLNEKVNESGLKELLKEKVLLEKEESIWLYNFWSKKKISGLLSMPITRHQIMHINNCYKLLEKYKKEHRTSSST